MNDPAATPTPDARDLIDRFAGRVTRKGHLHPPPADYFSPEQIQRRITAALRALKSAGNTAGYHAQALLCYAFLEQPEWLAADIAAPAGLIAPQSASRHLNRLADLDLLASEWRGYYRYWSLTTHGEQWLLRTVKGSTAPPAGEEPAAEPGKAA